MNRRIIRPRLWVKSSQESFKSPLFDYDEETISQRTHRIFCDLTEIRENPNLVPQKQKSCFNPAEKEELDINKPSAIDVDNLSLWENSERNLLFSPSPRSSVASLIELDTPESTTTNEDRFTPPLASPESDVSDITPSRYPKIRRKFHRGCRANLFPQQKDQVARSNEPSSTDSSDDLMDIEDTFDEHQQRDAVGVSPKLIRRQAEQIREMIDTGRTDDVFGICQDAETRTALESFLRNGTSSPMDMRLMLNISQNIVDE